MFDSVASAPPDPILGLTDAFTKDSRSDKINLTIGVYCDAAGRTPILDCVKAAEKRLLESETSKGYLSIDGLPEFRNLAAGLAIGDLIVADRLVTAQTPGGTGALRVAADFLSKNFRGSRVWVSTPTWPNHNLIFESAGLPTVAYPYLAADRKSLDIAAMLDLIEREGRMGDVICLHACCHNPTGIDPTPAQWSDIAELSAQRGMLPLVDFAYQGFGQGLDEDRVGLKALLEQHAEALVCSSFSKNFGLYSERVGAVIAICPSESQALAVGSSIKQCVRSNYSNPPRHGGAIVATILGDPELCGQWRRELDAMRTRIHEMRSMFVQGMQDAGCSTDYSFLLQQSGMFSFSGLTPMQVDWLRSERGIYIVGSGRINVAGITPSNLPQLTRAISQAVAV